MSLSDIRPSRLAPVQRQSPLSGIPSMDIVGLCMCLIRSSSNCKCCQGLPRQPARRHKLRACHVRGFLPCQGPACRLHCASEAHSASAHVYAEEGCGCEHAAAPAIHHFIRCSQAEPYTPLVHPAAGSHLNGLMNKILESSRPCLKPESLMPQQLRTIPCWLATQAVRAGRHRCRSSLRSAYVNQDHTIPAGFQFCMADTKPCIADICKAGCVHEEACM